MLKLTAECHGTFKFEVVDTVWLGIKGSKVTTIIHNYNIVVSRCSRDNIY